MASRKVGPAGENLFSAWCQMEGIVANKSVEDMNGWDVFIELDGASMNDPLSMHNGLIECKVQVKSTDGKKKCVDVELSNLHKMATTVLPAFYVLLEFDGGKAPTAAYIRHVDHDLCGEVLRRIREVTSTCPDVRLNKKKMRIHFDREIALSPGPMIEESIRQYVTGAQALYVAKKSEFLAAAGYEGGAHQLTFSVRPEELDAFINATLGRGGFVSVDDVEGHVVRFGISSPLSELCSPYAVFEILDVLPSERGRIWFKDRATGSLVAFDAELYRNSAVAGMPMELRRVRIKCPLLEIYVHGRGQLSIAAEKNVDSEYEVDEFLRTYQACQMISKGGDIQFGFCFGEERTINIRLPQAGEDLRRQIKTLERLLYLQNHFNYRHEFKVGFSEIGRREGDINNMYLFCTLGLHQIQLRFERIDNLDVGQYVCCVYVLFMKVGRHCFCEVLVMEGTVSLEGEDIQAVSVSQRESIYKTSFLFGDNSLRDLKEDIGKIMSDFKSEHVVVDFSAEFTKACIELEGDSISGHA